MKGRKPNPDRLPVIALAEGKDGTPSDPGAVTGRALAVAEPFCPEPVTENPDALEVWQRLVPELIKAGLVTPIFEGMLAAYCMVFARWVEAERELRKTAKLVKSLKKLKRLWPMVTFRKMKNITRRVMPKL